MAEDVPLALYLPAGLFLKPDPKISIEVRLPDIKQMGVSVSNWEVMEKTKILATPEVFFSLRVISYTREVIHFEGEFESTRVMRKVVLLIDGKSIKLSGFPELLKVRAKLKDVPHPTKEQWEDYFGNRGMESFDEERPGERPDTMVIRGLPVKWFVSRTSEGQPCPRILTQAFQKFGRVREVGIYQCSPSESSRSFSSFGPGTRALHFEAFIQYEKYSSFCNAITSMKGMKLLRLEEGGNDATAIIRVDFDRNAYLSDRNIRKRLRAEERRRRAQVEVEKEEEDQKKKEEEATEERKKKEDEERAQKKARKLEEKLRKKEEQARIVAELKAVAATRREEAQQLLSVLLAGAAEARYQEELREQREAEEQKERKRREKEKERKEKERAKRLKEESSLREQLIRNVQELEQRKLEVQRQLLLRPISNRDSSNDSSGQLKSAVVIPQS